MAKGMAHYTPDGKKHTGATHKMKDGTLHTGASHTSSSRRLNHSTSGGSKLSAKQQKIASAAPPNNKINGADFKALRGNKPKKKSRMASAMGYGTS
jgi:hypothetical protein